MSDYSANYSGSDDQNDVTVAADPGSRVFTLRDSLEPVTAGTGCIALGPENVVCRPGSGVFGQIAVSLRGGNDRAVVLAQSASSQVVVSAGPGADTVTGGLGDDRLTGDEGADDLDGGAGYDSLWGDEGADALDGGTEADALFGGAGSDDLRGGDGDDRIDARDYGAPDFVNCGPGYDHVATDGGDDIGTDCEDVAVLPLPPVNTVPPSISGTPRVGETLTADPGTWTGEDITFGFQWRRCDTDPDHCVDIEGARSSTYTVASADLGFRLQIMVTAWNGGGGVVERSELTAPVSP
ncbi:MAG TPA: hypothetical protein VF066_17175 [Thermoleophilaceae bacterium]